MESLVQAGAFDTMNSNRRQLLEHIDTILSYGSRIQEMEQSNQSDLFGDESGNGAAIDEPEFEPIEPWSNIERLNKERELIGFYLSGHPLNKYKDDIELFCSHTLKPRELEQLKDRTDVRCAGIITDVKRVTDKKGRPFAFVQVEDMEGTVEVIAFSDVYDRYMGLIQVDNLVVIEGNTDNRSGTTKIIAKSFERMQSMREKYQDKIELQLDIDTDEVTKDELEEMAVLFGQHRGQTNVRLNVLSREAKRPFAMHVRKFVVDPNDELMSELRNLIGKDAVALNRTN